MRRIRSVSGALLSGKAVKDNTRTLPPGLCYTLLAGQCRVHAERLHWAATGSQSIQGDPGRGGGGGKVVFVAFFNFFKPPPYHITNLPSPSSPPPLHHIFLHPIYVLYALYMCHFFLSLSLPPSLSLSSLSPPSLPPSLPLHLHPAHCVYVFISQGMEELVPRHVMSYPGSKPGAQSGTKMEAFTEDLVRIFLYQI